MIPEQLDEVFSALADRTRRGVVQALLDGGSTSVPALSARLPISRQAVAKHVATLEQAGLVERLPATGREVRYSLRGEALTPAAAWLSDAEQAWGGRLARLKRAVESG